MYILNICEYPHTYVRIYVHTYLRTYVYTYVSTYVDTVCGYEFPGVGGGVYVQSIKLKDLILQRIVISERIVKGIHDKIEAGEP